MRVNPAFVVWMVVLVQSMVSCAERSPGQGGRAGPPSVTLHQWAIERAPRLSVSTVTGNATPYDSDDPRAILKRVLAEAPDPAVVYPTEQYYYFGVAIGARLLSGNIRLVDAPSGQISLGCFDAFSESDQIVKHFRSGEDGVSVRYDEAAHTVEVAIDGVRRTFILDQSAFAAEEHPLLLEGERLISGIHDESGYYFHLLYYEPARAFYYILNTSRPMPETWTRGKSDTVETWFGARSRFCFIRHAQTGRYILVGVHARNVRQNTWFDGPFDQVPPRLPIRPFLERAYPYVTLAGGLDAHGNFLMMLGQRVAISPYQQYESGPALEEFIARVVLPAEASPRAWTGSTYESKMDWMPPTSSARAHQTATSTSWPANHWGAASRLWRADHTPGISQQWAPGHDASDSRLHTSP